MALGQLVSFVSLKNRRIISIPLGLQRWYCSPNFMYHPVVDFRSLYFLPLDGVGLTVAEDVDISVNQVFTILCVFIRQDFGQRVFFGSYATLSAGT